MARQVMFIITVIKVLKSLSDSRSNGFQVAVTAANTVTFDITVLASD